MKFSKMQGLGNDFVVIDCFDKAFGLIVIGFTFKTYNADDMYYAISRGLAAYRNAEDWKTLTDRALRCDFSWGRSANEYIRLYKSLKSC